MQKTAVRSAAVFSYREKTPGGVQTPPPPSWARVNLLLRCERRCCLSPWRATGARWQRGDLPLRLLQLCLPGNPGCLLSPGLPVLKPFPDLPGDRFSRRDVGREAKDPLPEDRSLLVCQGGDAAYVRLRHHHSASRAGGTTSDGPGSSSSHLIDLFLVFVFFRLRDMYRVSQNYPNMQFFAIFATALKPLML